MVAAQQQSDKPTFDVFGGNYDQGLECLFDGLIVPSYQFGDGLCVWRIDHLQRARGCRRALGWRHRLG